MNDAFNDATRGQRGGGGRGDSHQRAEGRGPGRRMALRSQTKPGSGVGTRLRSLTSLSFLCRKPGRATPPPPAPNLVGGRAASRRPSAPAPPPPAPFTEQTDAQPGQALPEPLAQALRELPPPLLLPAAVLLVQRQPVHVPGQARGQVGDGRGGYLRTQRHGFGVLVTWMPAPGEGSPERCGRAETTASGLALVDSEGGFSLRGEAAAFGK